MMKEIKLTDIKGVKVGQYENQEAATGCSVVIVENGATAGARCSWMESCYKRNQIYKSN